MKITAFESQVYYPLEVSAERRASNNQLSTQNNQIGCFETEMVSGNFSANGVRTTMTVGQTDEALCTFSERHLMGFTNMPHRQYAFDGMNNFNLPTVEEKTAKFAEPIRTEIGTIPDNDSLNTVEVDIRNFETSAKEALDDFTDGLLNLVHDQMEFINLACDELINAISGNFNKSDSNTIAEIPDIANTGDLTDPVVPAPQAFNFDKIERLLNLIQDQAKLINLAYDELITAISGNFNNDESNTVAEIPDIENPGDSANPTATASQLFNFDEFEMKLREKFIAALDELLKGIKETIYVQNNLVAKGNGAACASLSKNYDQMMESIVSNNHGSVRETFKTLA